MAKPTSSLRAFVRYDDLPRATILRNLRTNLPQLIRNVQSYVVFKFLPPLTPGGKRRKVPCYVHDLHQRHGKHGSEPDLAAMGTFKEALECYKHREHIAGIGIAALPHNGFCFFDLDRCINPIDRKFNAVATELLSWDTYVEYSPSGLGLRFIIAGNLHLDHKNHTDGFEIFSDKGFVTLTGCLVGRSLPPKKLTDAQLARVHALCERSTADSAPEGPTESIPSPLAPQRDKVLKALKRFSSDCSYEDWIKVGMALHSSDPMPGGDAFKIWYYWSKRAPERFANTSEEDMLEKWRGFQPGGGTTLATIFRLGGSSKDPKVPAKFVPVFADLDAPREELHPLAPGLFDHYGAYMFVGRAKIGKSRILGLMTASALTGGALFGYQFVKQCKVLALVLEEDADMLHDRLQTYVVDAGDHRQQLTIVDRKAFAQNVKYNGEDMDYLEWLDRVLESIQPDLVYVDPLVNIRIAWPTKPDSLSDRVTEQDYQIGVEMQTLAEKHKCVLVYTIHGSKRKHGFATGDFDPFEMVGTTSWSMAACTGSFVLLDKPGYKPLSEEEDDKQKVFSIRTRYQRGGDVHLLLQYGKHGQIRSLGAYTAIQVAVRDQLVLEALQEVAREAGAAVVWTTAAQLGAAVGVNRRTVIAIIKRLAGRQDLLAGWRLVSSHAHGYRLVQEGR